MTLRSGAGQALDRIAQPIIREFGETLSPQLESVATPIPAPSKRILDGATRFRPQRPKLLDGAVRVQPSAPPENAEPVEPIKKPLNPIRDAWDSLRKVLDPNDPGVKAVNERLLTDIEPATKPLTEALNTKVKTMGLVPDKEEATVQELIDFAASMPGTEVGLAGLSKSGGNLFGKINKTTIAKGSPVSGDAVFNEAVDDIMNKVLPAQVKARGLTKELYTKARIPAIEKLGQTLETPSGEETVKLAAKNLGIGRLPRSEVNKELQNLLTQEKKDAIINNLATNPNLSSPLDRYNAMIAMKRFFSPVKYLAEHPKEALEVPPNTPWRDFEIKLFRKAWGSKFTDRIESTILDIAPPPRGVDAATRDYLVNLPNTGLKAALGLDEPLLSAQSKLSLIEPSKYVPPPPIEKVVEKYPGQRLTELLIDIGKKPQPIESSGVESIKRFEQYALMPVNQRTKLINTLYKAGLNAVDALGIPKSVKFSFDLSYPFRQGAFLGARRPISWLRAWQPMIRSLRNDATAIKINRELLADGQTAQMVDKMGLDLYGVERGLSWMQRPETVASKIAEKYVPGVRMSERSASAFMNKLMTDSAKSAYRSLAKMNASEEEYRAMGSLLNQLAGRGSLPNFLKGTAGDIANKLLTSPRYVISRFQWPIKLFSSSKAVRQEAASTLVAWSMFNTALVGLAKASGAEVELDPRSPDAYKIRIGNKRIDIWIGYAQIIRLIAQLATGQRKTQSGEIIPVPRSEILGRFFQSKESPGVGAIVTLLSGETYTGEEVDLSKLSGYGTLAKETLAPAGIEEVVDAYLLEGEGSAAISSAEFIGYGISTYEPRRFMDWKDYIETSSDKMNLNKSQELLRLYNQYEPIKREYDSIKGDELRDIWRQANPLSEAEMYFWGDTKELSSVSAREHFYELLDRRDFDVELFPIRDIVEEEDLEKLSVEELLGKVINASPNYMARYIALNPSIMVTKDLNSYITEIEAMRGSDQKLLDKYELSMIDSDSKDREKYRKENPEVDAALNLWGKVSSLKSSTARNLLIEKANQLGIPIEIIPALEKKPSSSRTRRVLR